MHQHNIKRNFLQHHSIPILLARSIPIGCMVALLLLVGGLFWVDFGEGVKVYAASSSAVTSLSIANTNLSATVAPGSIGYLTTDVTYSATNVTEYRLHVTYANGKTGLTNGSTTIAGVGGKTGTVMKSTDSNLWGFGWTTSTNTNYDSLTYYTVPAYNTYGTGLSMGRLETGTADIGSTTKKIVFAARFASNNETLGNYQTQVLLSLVATPKMASTMAASVEEATANIEEVADNVEEMKVSVEGEL